MLPPHQSLPASSATEPLPPNFADFPIELPEGSWNSSDLRNNGSGLGTQLYPSTALWDGFCFCQIISKSAASFG
jgi:hypothetical protein